MCSVSAAVVSEVNFETAARNRSQSAEEARRIGEPSPSFESRTSNPSLLSRASTHAELSFPELRLDLRHLLSPIEIRS